MSARDTWLTDGDPRFMKCPDHLVVIARDGASREIVKLPGSACPFTVMQHVFDKMDGKPAAADLSQNPEGEAVLATAPAPASAAPQDGRLPGGVRDTSMEAYSALIGAEMSKQQRIIVDFMKAHPGACYTRQELTRDTGLTINATCGRVNELLVAGVLVEDGRKDCTVTRNRVNALRLA